MAPELAANDGLGIACRSGLMTSSRGYRKKKGGRCIDLEDESDVARLTIEHVSQGRRGGAPARENADSPSDHQHPTERRHRSQEAEPSPRYHEQRQPHRVSQLFSPFSRSTCSIPPSSSPLFERPRTECTSSPDPSPTQRSIPRTQPSHSRSPVLQTYGVRTEDEARSRGGPHH